MPQSIGDGRDIGALLHANGVKFVVGYFVIKMHEPITVAKQGRFINCQDVSRAKFSRDLFILSHGKRKTFGEDMSSQIA